MGASGSGKSTLLNILSGLDAPTAGVARVAGATSLDHDRARHGSATAAQLVGFVWQQTARNLLPYLTAAENVRCRLRFAGRRREERATAAAELLEPARRRRTARDRRPGEMSGGEQQRAAIAVALANEPEGAASPTSRPASWTPRPPARSSARCSRANPSWASPWSWSRTTPAVSEHVAAPSPSATGGPAARSLRRTTRDEHGRESVVAEEYAVLDRAGRLQLPARVHRRPRHAGPGPAGSWSATTSASGRAEAARVRIDRGTGLTEATGALAGARCHALSAGPFDGARAAQRVVRCRTQLRAARPLRLGQDDPAQHRRRARPARRGRSRSPGRR